MKQLTIKELAAYLPYGLKVRYKDCIYKKTHLATLSAVSKKEIETTYNRRFKGCIGDIISFLGNNNIKELDFKPILYPLDYLTKEITHNGETFEPIEKIQSLGLNFSFLDSQIFPYKEWDYEVVEQLLEWKLDIFNLIENNLAIAVTEDFNPYE